MKDEKNDMTKGPPNTLLRMAREKRQWKLEYVAAKLDVDSGTVGRWERGEQGTSRAWQYRLSDLYEMKLSELGFPEEPVDVSRQHWLVPYRRNDYYTGYEQTLQALYKALHTKRAAVLTQALSGLGGIGKTQLALEYAYRYRDEYTAVVWIGADSQAVLLSRLDYVAQQLGLSILEPRNQQQVLFAFHQWFSSQTNWLLILDNVEDLAILDMVFPDENARRRGHIVLTTRAQAVGVWANKIAVETMGEEEGATLLLRRAKVIPRSGPLEAAAEEDREKARVISAELDGLALALDQAGAYIDEAPSSLAEYLDLYRARRAALLRRRGTAVSGHPDSVTTTFELSFDKIQQVNPAAAELLLSCAFLHPDAIPEELIMDGASHAGALLQSVETDPIQLQEALGTLSRYSLLRRNVSARTLSTHRLVQAVLKDMMDEATQRQRAEQAVQAMVHAFALEGSDTWQHAERYTPHALACAELIEQLRLEGETAAILLSRTGLYLRQRAQYGQAQQFHEQALARYEQLFGPEDPEVATALNNLALVYQEQRKHAEAQGLFERAEGILAKAYPLGHPDRARILANLASCHRSQGELREACRLGELAVAMLEKTLGPEDLDLAAALSTLATVNRDQGDTQRAEPLYQRALAIKERALPPGHPLIAFNLSAFATNFHLQLRFDRAAAYQERALAILEQALGPDHPEVALCLFCLADTYMMRRDFKRAERCNLRSLAIYEKAEGPIHSDMAQPLCGLAMVAQMRGRYVEAEPLYQRALTILEQTQGPTYPDLIPMLRAYATLLYRMGRREKARALEARAEAIERKIRGEAKG